MWALGALQQLGVPGVLAPITAPAAGFKTEKRKASKSASATAAAGINPTSSSSSSNPVHVLLAALRRNNFELLRVHGQAADMAQLLKGLSQLSYRGDRVLMRALAAFTVTRSAQFRARDVQVEALQQVV